VGDPQEVTALLQAPDAFTVKGKRDRAILAVLIACALRRGGLAGLTVTDLQHRDGWGVFVDISGKGGRIRTLPVLDWVEAALRAWLQTARIQEGYICRAVSRWGSVVGENDSGERFSRVDSQGFACLDVASPRYSGCLRRSRRT
jgi:site-specific recombinase XerD